jgi:hypothetical protein
MKPPTATCRISPPGGKREEKQTDEMRLNEDVKIDAWLIEGQSVAKRSCSKVLNLASEEGYARTLRDLRDKRLRVWGPKQGLIKQTARSWLEKVQLRQCECFGMSRAAEDWEGDGPFAKF